MGVGLSRRPLFDRAVADAVQVCSAEVKIIGHTVVHCWRLSQLFWLHHEGVRLLR